MLNQNVLKMCKERNVRAPEPYAQTPLSPWLLWRETLEVLSGGTLWRYSLERLRCYPGVAPVLVFLRLILADTNGLTLVFVVLECDGGPE